MNAPANYDPDDIDLIKVVFKIRLFLGDIWAERKLIVKVMAISAAVGLFLAFGSAEEYTATTKLLPYRSGSSGASGLSGLAGLAGIRLPAGASEQTITADLYPEVLKSQDFRITVAETPLAFSSLSRRATTVEYFRDLRRTPPVELVSSYTLGLPATLLNLMRSVATGDPKTHERIDTTQAIATYDSKYLGFVNTLEKRLTISIDRKTFIITISGKMPDPYASADLVRVASDRLMERVIYFESRKAAEQFRFVKEQYQQAKQRYERAQRDLALFSDRNRALMSATANIDRDRLQRENDLAFEVFQQFSRELEQARIKMNQDTPVFTVIEKVMVPTVRTEPRRTLLVLGAVVFGMILGVGRVGVRRLSQHE
jgi:uncharacterized protein involved in exopolysaccharide biosynthesis